MDIRRNYCCCLRLPPARFSRNGASLSVRAVTARSTLTATPNISQKNKTRRQDKTRQDKVFSTSSLSFPSFLSSPGNSEGRASSSVRERISFVDD